jgi:hypothetical protein
MTVTTPEQGRFAGLLAWMGLLLSGVALLIFLLPTIAIAVALVGRMAPRDDSMKATMYARDVFPIGNLAALVAAVGASLGLGVLRARPGQPSSRHARVARAAILMGLLALLLALVIRVVGPRLG